MVISYLCVILGTYPVVDGWTAVEGGGHPLGDNVSSSTLIFRPPEMFHFTHKLS